MEFRREAEMAGLVARWLQSRGLTVKHEYQTPWGVCDLVAAQFDGRRVRSRLARGQRKPIGSANRIELLLRIPQVTTGTYVTTKTLEREFADIFAADKLIRALESLERDGFVARPRRGAFQRLDGWAPLHKRIVAVELKLLRIQDAIAQASAHFRFADEAFVALPDAIADRLCSSRRVEGIRNHGLGLLAVSTAGCRILVKPKRPASIEQNPLLQMHCVERFWRASFTDTAT